jgi:hypothetical protein
MHPSFHATLALALLLDQIVLAIWALVLGFRRQPVSSALFSALIVDEILMILQSLVGGYLLVTGHAPQAIHFLYGGLLLVLLPAMYLYAGRRERAGVWMGAMLLFMGGMIIRISFTG